MLHRLFLLTFTLLFGALTAHAASDGVLTVKTQPDGVEVWLDDKYIGDTPVMEKRLKPGKYTVKLIDAVRHTSSIEEVFIQAGETTVVEKTMKNKFGSLNVTSEPEGAEVFVLLPLGKTPVSNDYMKPGKYRLEVRHPNSIYGDVSQDITLTEGETVDISQTLEAGKVFDNKALLRIGFGLGAVAGFVYGIVQHGYHKEFKQRDQLKQHIDELEHENYNNDIRSTGIKRTVGIVVGSVCVLGFEIVGFF